MSGGNGGGGVVGIGEDDAVEHGVVELGGEVGDDEEAAHAV